MPLLWGAEERLWSFGLALGGGDIMTLLCGQGGKPATRQDPGSGGMVSCWP